MITALTVEETKEMFLYVAEQVIRHKDLLTEMDSAIGDGDHGIGMALGFTKVKENLEQGNINTINEIFKTIGMSMINSMGGASGVIFGTMFIGGVKDLEPLTVLNKESFRKILKNALYAVKQRGKAQIGDKTMIDALEPAACSIYSDHINDDLLQIFETVEMNAREGMEKTKEFTANFGRAKALGERAIGYKDAGATSVWVIFKSMYEWLSKKENVQ